MTYEINQACWNEAVEHFKRRLTNDPKKRGSGWSKDYPTSTCGPSDLLTAAEQIKSRLAKERATAKWSKRLEDLISQLWARSAVVDVAIQQQPHTTSLVWGAIRFVIQVIVAQQETSKEIEEALDFIVPQISNYRESLSLFPQEISIRESTTKIYALLISYVFRSFAYLRLPRPVRFLKAAFSPLRKKLADIRRSIQEEERILTLSRELAAETRNREEQARMLANQAEMQRDKETDRQLDRIRRWLDIPPGTAERIPDWQEGTCSWILQNDTFQQWSEYQGAGCLYIHGKAGCGKSVMAKYLATELKEQCVLTHFFRDHGDYRFGLGSSFALSLISQALERNDILKNPALDQVLATVIPHMNMPSSKCQLETLLSILNKLLDLLPAVTMLIDALDECRDIREPNDPLIDFFRDSGARRNRWVILFCRSHHYVLDGIFKTGHTIAMDEKTMEEDIRRFLMKEIEKMGLEGLQDVVFRKASTDSEGMFLWARLMVKHLKGGRNLKACKRLVEEFPAGLFEAYEKFITQSEKHFATDDLDLRSDIFRFLVGAQENLTAAEISTAMAFSHETHKIDDESKLIDAENRITRVCSPLIEFTPDRKIQFIHGTVKKFLLSEHIRSGQTRRKNNFHLSWKDCNETLARKTLAALTQELYQTWQYSAKLLQKHLLSNEDIVVMVDTVHDENEFYEYSCRHWQDHLNQLAEPASDILNLLCKFLRGNEFVAWSETMVDLMKLSNPSVQVSVRATLQEWYKTTLKQTLRPKVPLEDFFLVAHQALKYELSDQTKIAALPYLPLVRLGDFYNVGGETVAEWELGYKFKKEVVAGYEVVLGKQHRLTLSARTRLYQEYFWQMRMDEAKEGLQEVSDLQLVSVGKDLPDYYTTLFYLGVAEFHLTLFEDSCRTLRTSVEGFQRLLGEISSMAIQAKLFIGYALEAQGHLSEAVALYDDIWNNWTHIAGENNGIALMIQTAQGSAYRKQEQFHTGRKLLEHSWRKRKQLFTIENNVTVDSGIQLAILYRDSGDDASATDTLHEVDDSTIFPKEFERSCQIDHLRAHIDFDSGRYDDGKNRLIARLHEADNGDKDRNNRELLWIRITLADVMRAHGEDDDALMLFMNLVKPLSPDELDEEPEPRTQLEIAEKALRYMKSSNQQAAAELLQEHMLKWRRTRDFWILQGGPISDTARMAPPRDTPN